jgi:hypothetical protein
MAETPKKTATPRKTAAKKKAVPTPKAQPVAATHHEVALLAYHLWLNRGKNHGNDAQDWLHAEEQLKNR